MSEDHDEGGSERWLVSYADFITLLFAFFTVLYATSERNAEKTEQFQESVKKYLIKAAGGGGLGAGSTQINEADHHNAVIEPPIKTFRDRAKPEGEKPLERVEAFVDGLTAEERLRYVADLAEDDWGVRITLPAAPLFAPASDTFRPEAVAFLRKLGQLIVKSKRRATVEGHAATGEAAGARSTWDFAAARAINVLRFVAKAAAIPADRLAASSFGDSRPLFKDGDPGRNARIEIVLLNSDLSF